MKQPILLFTLAVLLFGCAQTGPPTGGPEDETPPAILSTIPASGSTNVDTSIVITLEFDEAVKQSSLRQAFGLSPPPPGVVRSKWKGNKVEISFEPALLPDRTYALTIGTQLSDNKSNRLDETFVLAFSTGDKLDTGWLRGRMLISGEAIGWNILGYLLDDSTDAPDPSLDAPDATTQTAKDGSWQLSNLRSGLWRVFAFKDVDGDRLWTPWMEKRAVPAYDVEAVEDTLTLPRLLLLKPSDPVLMPNPQRVTAQRKDHWLMRLDRKPRKLEVDFSLEPLPELPEGETYPEEWEIVDSDFSIPVFSRGYKPGDSTVVQIGLERIPDGEAVGLRIFGSFGTVDTLDTVLAVDLLDAALEDTLPPALVSVNPEERARLHPGENRIRFVFSEPIRIIGERGVRFVLGEDTLFPQLATPYPNQFSFDVDRESPGGAIAVQVFGDSIRDGAGNTLKDSLLTYRYAWLPQDSLGTLMGTVLAPDSTAPVQLTFRDVLEVHQARKITVPGAGPFTLPLMPASRWVVEGWQDVSRTLTWFEGVTVPFEPSDPVVVSMDTIDVRARWETGGVEIIFP